MRSARRNSTAATAIAAASSTASTAGTTTPGRMRERRAPPPAGTSARGVDNRVVPASGGASVLRRWASARAKSAHRSKRSFGSFANALPSTGSTPDRSGRRWPIVGGVAERCWLITTAGLECTNGGEPVSRWKAVAANEY